MTSRVLHLILNTFVILFLKDGNPITAVWPPTRPLLYVYNSLQNGCQATKGIQGQRRACAIQHDQHA